MTHPHLWDDPGGPPPGFRVRPVPAIASALMRRSLVPLLVAPLCAIGLMAASGCGVTADDAAATVGGATVSTATVDDMAGDAAFVGAVLQGAAPATDDGVLPGETARNTLSFEIQRTALLQEVDRWGLQVTDGDRSDARSRIDEQVPGLTKKNLDRLVEYVVATSVLEQRLGEVDADSDADLRLLYDGTPSLWDQVCLTAVQIPSTKAAERAARAALDSGTSLADLADKVDDAQLAAEPSQGCIARTQLPPAIRTDAEAAATKELRGPIVVEGAQGNVAYFYRVESTKQLSFAQAREDLASLAGALQQRAQQQAAAQLWLSLILQQGVTINPRYGSDLVVGSQGQLEITPPEAPAGAFPVATMPKPDATTGGSSGSGTSGSGSSDAGNSGAAPQTRTSP